MKKHISQKGGNHLIKYLEQNKNSTCGCDCSFYDNGKCIIDGSQCMDSGYCNSYTTESVADQVHIKKILDKKIKIFNLEINDKEIIENISVYVSENEYTCLTPAIRISYSSELGEILYNLKSNTKTFEINEVSYKVLSIEYKNITEEKD